MPVAAEQPADRDAGDELTDPAITGIYPNPFNPATAIEMKLTRTENVMLEIYDVRGALVRTLSNGEFPAGTYRSHWDGRDDNGQRVASGVYFARLVTDSYQTTRKLVMMK